MNFYFSCRLTPLQYIIHDITIKMRVHHYTRSSTISTVTTGSVDRRLLTSRMSTPYKHSRKHNVFAKDIILSLGGAWRVASNNFLYLLQVQSYYLTQLTNVEIADTIASVSHL